MSYQSLDRAGLEALHQELQAQYDAFQARGLKLDMSRGKPGAEQLNLSMEMLKDDFSAGVQAENGFDCRNYGILDGIPECKKLFSDMLEVSTDNVIIMGNSSLNVMYDYIAQCMLFGAGAEPWSTQGKIKFLCPAPGYDRHFSICAAFGIEMITVPMLEDGPDTAMLAELVKDPGVKGMFCVPKYSNPEGKTYSAAAVDAIAALQPAAKDFRVIWDNAYIIHDLYDTTDYLPNIFEVAKKYGTEDHFIEVASSSKVTFPGSGVAVIAASDNNIAAIKKRMGAQTIGHDKLNQLRHVRFFGDLAGMKAHMQKHAAVLRPRFEAVLNAFDKELADTGVAQWTRPNGGYFISLNVMDGCAKRVVTLCKEAGVVLTGAGATYPYGKDPADKNIRVAPTYPSVEDLKTAVELLCISVKLAAVEKLLAE